MMNVYVMATERQSPCKIGISNNPKKRLASVQTGHPEPLILWASWEPEHLTASEIERLAHQHFSANRLKGEWFSISVKDAERFIGRVESEKNGYRWITTHSDMGPVRVFDGLA